VKKPLRARVKKGGARRNGRWKPVNRLLNRRRAKKGWRKFMRRIFLSTTTKRMFPAFLAFLIGLVTALWDPIRDRIVVWVYGDRVQVTVASPIRVDVGQTFAIRPVLSPVRLSSSSAGVIKVRYDGEFVRLRVGSDVRAFSKVSGSITLEPFYFHTLVQGQNEIVFTVEQERGAEKVMVISERDPNRDYITQYDFTGRWKTSFCRHEFDISTMAVGQRDLTGSVVAHMETTPRKQISFQLKGAHDSDTIEMNFGIKSGEQFESYFKLSGKFMHREDVWFEYPATIHEVNDTTVNELFGADFLKCLLDKAQKSHGINIRTGYKPSLL